MGSLLGSILGGIIQADAQIQTNAANKAMTMSTNETNLEINKQTNEANRQIADSTNQANRELAEKQNQWNFEQWQRENAYNSPKEQVKRLMEAGLSPAAAAQAIEGAGNAGQLVSADLANQQMGAPMQSTSMLPALNDAALIPSFTGMIRDIIESRKLSAEASKEEKEAKLWDDMLLTDMDAKRADIAFKKNELEQAVKSFPYTLRSLKYKVRGDKYIPELNKWSVKNSEANYMIVQENVKLARQQFSFLEKMNDASLKKSCEEIKNLVQERQNLIKSGKNIDVYTENAKKQGKILDEQVYQEELTSILKQSGFPDDQAGRVGALIASGKLNPMAMEATLKGVRDYVKQGHKYLGDDPLTKEFLYYYWDKGSSESRKTGFHSRSTLLDIMQSLQDGYK